MWFGEAHAQLGMTPDETSGSLTNVWSTHYEYPKTDARILLRSFALAPAARQLRFFNRYNLISEADIRDAARTLEAKTLTHRSFIVGSETDSEQGWTRTTSAWTERMSQPSLPP